jgi:hypothetical protein
LAAGISFLYSIRLRKGAAGGGRRRARGCRGGGFARRARPADFAAAGLVKASPGGSGRGSGHARCLSRRAWRCCRGDAPASGGWRRLNVRTGPSRVGHLLARIGKAREIDSPSSAIKLVGLTRAMPLSRSRKLRRIGAAAICADRAATRRFRRPRSNFPA